MSVFRLFLSLKWISLEVYFSAERDYYLCIEMRCHGILVYRIVLKSLYGKLRHETHQI